MYVKEVLVQNKAGLHARPATFFIQKANEYKSTIWVEKEERRVNAKSLLRRLILISKNHRLISPTGHSIGKHERNVIRFRAIRQFKCIHRRRSGSNRIASRITDIRCQELICHCRCKINTRTARSSYGKGSHAVSERGPEFINSTTNGYDAAVANFANGKTLFIKQGNWCYTNIKNANSEIVDTLTILPIKMPFEQGDIAVDGLTVEHMNSSIPVFCGNYYVLNKQVSQHELEEAQKFLVWLNTSEEGQHYVTEEMAFIPYNADPATTVLGNSLSDCIIGYMSEGNTLTKPTVVAGSAL